MVDRGTACANCGTQGDFSFCPVCGQERGPLQPPLRQWLKGVVDELFLVDGRVPRSIKLLARPGALTEEWAVGRRARYVAPIRLFLISAILFLFVWELAGERQGNYFVEFISGTLEGMDQAMVDAYGQARLLADRIVSALQVLLLVVAVPLLAALTHGLRDTSGRMVLHLIFALHLHAFGLALATVWLLVGYAVPSAASFVGLLVPMALVAVYLAAALRRVFSLSIPGAIIQAVGVTLTYWFLGTVLAAVYGMLPLVFGK